MILHRFKHDSYFSHRPEPKTAKPVGRWILLAFAVGVLVGLFL